MDIKRMALYSSIAFVVFMLWNSWQREYPVVVTPSASPYAEQKPTSTNSNINTTINKSLVTDTSATHSLPIEVKTDLLQLKIDLTHGDIVAASLLKYPEKVDDPKPFELLSDNPNKYYVANSMLVSPSQKGYEINQLNFKANKTTYQLAPNQETLVVTLEGHNSSGLNVIKTFTFTRGKYLIDVDYLIKNDSTQAWTGFVDTRLTREGSSSSSSSLLGVGTYTGASYSEPGVHNYKKVSFEDMTKHPLDIKATGGWIAMQQHYFLSAWIPNPHQNTAFYSQAVNNHYSIGAMNDVLQVKPGQQVKTNVKLYLGPEIAPILKQIAPGLDLTIDYGWFWFISGLLLNIMTMIEKVLGNWGWSIIAITILIKLAFYRLSAKSYHSMANMRRLQPKIEALKARYGEDKAKLSQATMELYKQEKINPLGGCLPIVVQIPVFFALYWALIESVELRQAPFIFWINDLSAPDPYHVLPIIMGFTMLIQQRLNPTPPDPMQAKMMMFLPILFTGLFWNFPSGLVLYWIVNNILSILQQWWITRSVEAKTNKPKLKKIAS